MILHVILMALAPIFFVMALGFGAGRTRTIDNHHVGELNAVVMDFALPASLFVGTASAPRSVMMAQGGLFAILSFAMLLRYSFGMEEDALLIEKACVNVLKNGLRTADIMAPGSARVGTGVMGESILRELDKLDA